MYGQQKYTPLPSDNLVKMRWARYNEAINVNDNASAFCEAKYDEEIRKTLPYYEDFYKQVDRFLSNLKIFYKPAVAAAGIIDRKEAGMKREIRTVFQTRATLPIILTVSSACPPEPIEIFSPGKNRKRV